MSVHIYIGDLPKGALLRALCGDQIPAGFFSANGVSVPVFDTANADAAVARGYIDYYSGKAIKCDLSQDTVDPWLYDRDAGAGAFARAVARVRAAL